MHAGAATAARVRMSRPQLPASVERMLRFTFPAPRHRDAAPDPGSAAVAEPGSIKEAIARWLDEQL